MNFDLTEEQALLKNMVERFVADRYNIEKRRVYAASPIGFSPDNWAMLAELGVLSLPFPENLGGLAGGPVELMVTMEALGRGFVLEPVLASIVLAGGLLQRAASNDQKTEVLSAVMAGSAHLALAHAETDARYNLHHVSTRARVDGNDIYLSGCKTFALAGGTADWLIVSARTGEDESDIEFFLVPADAEGLERRSYRLVDGSHAAEVLLQETKVSLSARLQGGLDAFEEAVAAARLGASAEMLGIMSAMFDETLEYLRTRRQFGVPIGSFQALQHRASHLYLLLEQSRSLLYGAALADDQSRQAAIAGAKAFISEAALFLGHECIQFHGGMGVSDELAIGHGHKRLMVLATLLGDADATLEDYIRHAA